MSGFQALTDLRKDMREIKSLLLLKVRAEDRTFSYEEAAGYLKITVRTLQNRVSAKQVPFIKDGRTVLFYKSDLDKYLEMRRAA